ncbi:hypothetical protein HanRHA438_Chr15g0706331 [Helianthus annuus]|nr:hypothetical protein HanRHA438_Chr15g0706331 [Helianthus annuus]
MVRKIEFQASKSSFTMGSSLCCLMADKGSSTKSATFPSTEMLKSSKAFTAAFNLSRASPSYPGTSSKDRAGPLAASKPCLISSFAPTALTLFTKSATTLSSSGL